jgi:hypothetical protein
VFGGWVSGLFGRRQKKKKGQDRNPAPLLKSNIL